ncbi:MAG: aminopeptidase [Bacteroidaceae bacterium]|nr:aminopeptidase [Bacteroidaceae bacterium]
MKAKSVLLLLLSLLATAVWAQTTPVPPGFTVVCQNPITAVKDQHRSGTCWDFATLGFFESEVLRTSGRALDLCEMFVVNKDYMDCATHFVRMHGYSQLTEGGSADDVLDVLRTHGICPEEAMPAPGTLCGDTLANFERFVPLLHETIRRSFGEGDKHPAAAWRDSVQAVIDAHVGRCPETFEYEGRTYTPRSFADALGLDWDDYVSLTSYTHHPFDRWFVIEAPYKWRLKPSYNIPLDQLLGVLDRALERGYCVAWGGDVSGGFLYNGMADVADGVQPTQQQRQREFDDWTFTYDHVMLVYGKARDAQGRTYYMVKNSWGRPAGYGGTWYMSRDYMALNTTYLFLNRRALPRKLQKAMRTNGF